MSRIEDVLAGLEPDWPETPDPWPAVAARLAEPPPERHIRPAVAAVAIIVAAVVLGGALAGAIPAIADRLGIGSVEIDAAEVGALSSALSLGEQVEPGAAGVPVPSVLGPPEAAFVDDGIGWLVYAPRADLQEVLDSGVGALVARIDGGAILQKLVDPAVTQRLDVEVRGAAAVWLEGGPHAVYVEEGNTVSDRPGRLAGNTLLWVVDGVTYRLELAEPLGRALEIAESMEP